MTSTIIGLALGVAGGTWLGWLLCARRASTREDHTRAVATEQVRAAGCARDRAIEERQRLEERVARLQTRLAGGPRTATAPIESDAMVEAPSRERATLIARYTDELREKRKRWLAELGAGPLAADRTTTEIVESPIVKDETVAPSAPEPPALSTPEKSLPSLSFEEMVLEFLVEHGKTRRHDGARKPNGKTERPGGRNGRQPGTTVRLKISPDAPRLRRGS